MDTAIKKRTVVIPFPDSKKRKMENTICKILRLNPTSKQWLIEWQDSTRTWEKYDNIKDNPIFREYIENLVSEKIVIPSYIN
jgi:hypothetical protein